MYDHQKLLRKMKKRGWTSEEIEHASIVFQQHELKHHIIHPFYDKILHWIIFLSILIGNFLIFTFSIPIIILFEDWFGYFLISLIAFSVGILFELIINNFNHLKLRHHLFIGIGIPTISMFTFIFFLLFLRKTFSLKTLNLFLICGLYSAFLILPYYLRITLRKIKKWLN